MPAPAIVKNSKASGMNKAAEAGSAANGGIGSQGVGDNFNSTYPANVTDTDKLKSSNAPKTEMANGAPINLLYAHSLPTTPTPIGTVDLSAVNKKAK